MLIKPYKRIIRPFPGSGGAHFDSSIAKSHLVDENYASDRVNLIRAFKLLEKDLVKLFDYVEPDDCNSEVFSHRIYELFLRSCTEFELNCKNILLANNYSFIKPPNIEEYHKINKANHLSDYEVSLLIWRNPSKIFQPFKLWSTTHTLNWYKKYNNVKHNRDIYFKDANLGNLINAISGVFCILFSQFSVLSFQSEYLVDSFNEEMGWYSHPNSIFRIKPFDSWKNTDKYSFTWSTLKHDPRPFDIFPFEK